MYYDCLINIAILDNLGELTGVGVQLLSNSEGNVIISAIEDDSPASGAGLQNGVTYNMNIYIYRNIPNFIVLAGRFH